MYAHSNGGCFPPSFSPSFSFSRHSLPPLFQFPALLFPLFFPLFLPFSPFSARRLAPSLRNGHPLIRCRMLQHCWPVIHSRVLVGLLQEHCYHREHGADALHPRVLHKNRRGQKIRRHNFRESKKRMEEGTELELFFRLFCIVCLFVMKHLKKLYLHQQQEQEQQEQQQHAITI